MREVFIFCLFRYQAPTAPGRCFLNLLRGCNPVYIRIQDSNGLALGGAKHGTELWLGNTTNGKVPI